MTKQQGIREGLGKIELEVNDLCGILEGHVHLTPQGREKVLQYLTAKDVVIKVTKDTDDFLKGYERVEPLIEGVKNGLVTGAIKDIEELN